MNIRVLVLLLVTLPGWSQGPKGNVSQPGSEALFDGRWWSGSSIGMRSGFINGVSDCMTWSAHESGFNATPEELVAKIDMFYKKHPGSDTQAVVEVWRMVSAAQGGANAHPQKAQEWRNPHWYLDGFWWREVSDDERLGYIEGYLWCMRTHVPSESYSKSARFYAERIDDRVSANGMTRANREAIADMLRRHRDKRAPHAEKP